MPSHSPLVRLSVAARIGALALCTCAPSAAAQRVAGLPFAPGERFEYIGRAHGVTARGSMRVEGPADLRGTAVWTLHSEMEGKLGFIRGTDRSVSWIDPARMSALRYSTRERHVISKHDDEVDIFASEKRWAAKSGLEGPVASEAPLDELSFLYYVRTLPLVEIGTTSMTRHFDAARNPTVVRVVMREDITVGAGTFHAIVVELRVRDTRRYRGEGLIRIHLSDDACRLILRLESTVPDAGKATLALQSFSGVRGECTAKLP